MPLTAVNKKIDIDFLLKNKKKIINGIIIIIGFIIALNIYNAQKNVTLTYKKRLDQEKKKNDLLKELVDLENKLVKVKDILKFRDISEIITKVTKIIEESGLKILNVRPLPEENNPLYTKSRLKFLLEAEDYHAIGNFVAHLESDEDLYKIESLYIKPAKRSGVTMISSDKQLEEENVLNLEITIAKFVFKG